MTITSSFVPLVSNAPTVLRTWGKHLILDAGGCSPKMIGDSTVITNFAKTLVKRIDMVAYGQPQVVMFGTGNKKGYTLIQLIETSNIAAHFVEENNSMYLDVFSCKDFDPDVVKEAVHEFFDAKKFRTKVMLRQAPLVNYPMVHEAIVVRDQELR
jgi:S-adenosylmethionine/arginine decarboxylase-like enzyme